MPANTTVYLGLGSNLNQPMQQIKQAIEALSCHPLIQVLAQSSLYESLPLGPQDQPNFINAVIKISTSLTPQQLLLLCQNIEQQHGRVKTRHWGERTLDIDILLYGEQLIDLPELKIPHPQMHKRNFVLLPLLEIAPELTANYAERPATGKIKRVFTQ